MKNHKQPKKLKIAHISMFYLPTFGGVEQVIYELAQRQINEGHEVHVFCCDSDKNKRIKPLDETLEGVRVHRVPYLLRLSLNTHIWPGLFSRFKEINENIGGFDIIHTHVSGHAYVLQAGIIAKAKNIRHIHTTHCPWTGTEFRPPILRPFIFLNDLFFNKLSYTFIDKIIAITPWELDKIKSYVPDNKQNQEKIKVIPNGVDKIFFSKVKNNGFKEKNKISEKNLVLFFGRLNPTKGPEKLAEAAVNLTKSGKAKENDIAFVFVGPDEGKAEEVKSIIKGYKNIHYIGALKGRDKVAEMYQASNVYVLPSYREGLPLTLFEAMASGLPIIASPVNGIPYEMSSPENGLFCEYGDIKCLEESILKLISNKKLTGTISKNNKMKAKNYDWDLIYKKYMGEYFKLLSKTKK